MPPTAYHPRAAVEIGQNGDVGEPGGLEQREHRLALGRADLDHQPAPGCEPGAGGGDAPQGTP